MIRAVAIVGLVTLVGQQPTAPPPAGAQTPPATDIYELAFNGQLETLKGATPQAISVAPGYDNQPFYTPDGAAVLFTANRDGKQTDIYEFDRVTRRVRQLVATPEGEYSATITPDGKAFSVIRVEADGTQRLWRFDRNGSNPKVVLPRSSQSVITPGWMRIDWSSSSSGSRQRFRPHRCQPARVPSWPATSAVRSCACRAATPSASLSAWRPVNTGSRS